MRKAIVILVVISLVLTGFLMLPVPGEQENEVSSPSETRDSARGNTLYVGVGQEYSEILYAVEDASAGDTIRVYAGTYYKGFELNKKLTIIGNGSDDTFLNFGKINFGIYIQADHCTIEGLNIYGYNYTRTQNVIILDSDFNQIKDCIIHSNNSCYSIYMDGSNNNTISNCTLTKNSQGVDAGSSNDNIIENCLIKGNNKAVEFSKCKRNKILNCEIISNKHWGITVHEGSSNEIINTYLYGNTNGLGLGRSQNNRIINVTNEYDKNSGIYISRSNNNLIKNSRFQYNGYVGCRVYSWFEITSENNEIKNNLFIGNPVSGLTLESDDTETTNNLIFNNTFIDNGLGQKGDGHQAIDDGFNNKWDNGTTGNHWSDSISPDSNDDRIVDNPYVINGTAGAKDNYPLVNPTHSTSTSPIISTANIVRAYVGYLYSIQYSASDSDTPKNEFIWSMSTNASWLKFSSEQELYGIPKYSDLGKHWVYISVSDGSTIDSSNFTINVGIDYNSSVYIDRTGQGFMNIQDAVDAAISGDTIRVLPRFYQESVVINKPLKLIGEDKASTIIEASDKIALEIRSKDTNVSCFTIRNSDTGIYLNGIMLSYDSFNCNILNNKFVDNKIGIHSTFQRGFSVKNCQFKTNQQGIVIDNSYIGSVTNCEFDKNYGYAISLLGGNSSNDNIIIWNNTFLSNNGASSIYDSLHIQASDNTMVGNNYWNSYTDLGNYWSDWTSPDSDDDGFVDKPYLIDGTAGAKDFYPIAEVSSGPSEHNGFVINERTEERFTKIQDAIDKAIDGDTIWVWAGTYVENVVIDKTLTLIGNGSSNTIIDAKDHSNVISITAEDGCRINGFNITGGELNKELNCICGSAGIWIQSKNVIIEECEINNVYEGLEIRDASNIEIINCSVYNNKDNGIYLYESSKNIISNNFIYNNGKAGIYLWYSYNNNIENCTFKENNNNGIRIWNSHLNLISNCSIEFNSYNGIELMISSEIKFASTENNSITNNNMIRNHGLGIRIGLYCKNNLIHHNNFIYNSWGINNSGIQADDFGSYNKWNTSTEGNYWSQWTGPDNNNDGIVDLPYNLSGSADAKDHYPLVRELDLGGYVPPTTTPSHVISSSLVNNSYNISISTSEIVITFSQSMDPNIVESFVSISQNVNYTLIWENNYKTLRINLNEDLSYNTTYKISIDAPSQDHNSNLLDSPFELIFTTEGPIDDADNNGDEPGKGDFTQYIIYTSLVIIILIVILIIMFAVITKSRRKQKVGTGGKATQPEERLELSGSKIAEEFYTDPDLTNDSKELIDVLKDKALTLKKPSDFGPSHDKKLKKVQKKYRKGEISKDTYESIKEIMGKRDQT